MIHVTYKSIDRFRETRTFKTLEAARRYAEKWIGENPEIGSHYAISGDGVGKIQVTGDGVSLTELFGMPPRSRWDSDTAYRVRQSGDAFAVMCGDSTPMAVFGSREDAERYVQECRDRNFAMETA